MKTYIFFTLISIMVACGPSQPNDNSVSSDSQSSVDTTENSKSVKTDTTDRPSNLVGIWVLEKGGGNKTEYSIRKKEGKLILKTKIFMPQYDPFSTESELVKVNEKYVREDENIPNPPYMFDIKKGNLIIYDQFGIYADLKNQMKK